jgi:hypothetical protein
MDQNPKQQVVERIKSATNILVTVSKDPSVDQLAACIGFTLMLNKFGKHATAVFSGAVPSTLEFLQPEKTLEKNTNSLQDFIIALDKSKADKLRYKVEDDVVRIFITPYRTSLSEKDLQFSLGDFNVDVVVALGVTKKEDIDQAIVAHGRILHDATVMALTAGPVTSDVGSINWHEATASSLSEMLVSISESFQSGLLDPQMATSFLTGIVAETERFSNTKTSPKVMTMSAQLMAAGANQQLIATKLAPPPPEPPAQAPAYTPNEAPKQPAEEPKKDGEIEIEHEEDKPAEPEDQDEIHIDDEGNLKVQAELRAAEEARKAAEAKAAEEKEAAEKAAAESAEHHEDVPEEKPADENSYITGQSHKVLDPLPGQGAYDPLLPDVPQPPAPAAPALDLPPLAPAQPVESLVPPLPPVPTAPPEDSLTQLEQAVDSPHLDAAVPSVDDARQAVTTAGLDIPPPPQPQQSLGAQHVDLDDLLPPVPVPDPAIPSFPSPAPTPAVAPAPPLPEAGTPLPPLPTQDSSVNPLSPPPVPPPMTAPYFEPKTSHHNPYLNPQDQPKTDSDNDIPV